MQEKENPDANGDFPNFIDKTIVCAPLKVNYYEAGRHKVRQALVSLTTWDQTEALIKATLRYMYGRRFMKVLINHFAGEVNATRNVAKA